MTDPVPSFPPTGSDAVFVRRAFWVLLIVALAYLLWQLSDLLLLVFGAVVVAAILRALADAIGRVTGLSERWSLVAATLACIALLGLAGWLFGAQVRAQVDYLVQTLPAAWRAFQEYIGDTDLGQRLVEAAAGWAPSTSGMVRNVGNVAAITLASFGKLLLVLVGGIYLAAQPRIYRRGLLEMVPPASRDTARDALGAVDTGLRRWLIANLAAMVAVGVLTGFGLWAIGLPSALTLGLLAGIAEFVPILGPILAAIPALLIALTLGTETLLWTLALYVVIQQLESNVIMPMVTRRAVSIPPALALFSVVALGILFGPVGLLFGAPLAVVLFVLVRELYVKPMG